MGMPAVPWRLVKSSCDSIISLDEALISMEVSSHGEYPGARLFTEEGYAKDACSGTKTANPTYCMRECQKSTLELKSNSRDHRKDDSPFLDAFCG